MQYKGITLRHYPCFINTIEFDSVMKGEKDVLIFPVNNQKLADTLNQGIKYRNIVITDYSGTYSLISAEVSDIKYRTHYSAVPRNPAFHSLFLRAWYMSVILKNTVKLPDYDFLMSMYVEDREDIMIELMKQKERRK